MCYSTLPSLLLPLLPLPLLPPVAEQAVPLAGRFCSSRLGLLKFMKMKMGLLEEDWEVRALLPLLLLQLLLPLFLLPFLLRWTVWCPRAGL